MFLVEGLYKRIELLSKHLCLCNEEYDKENELLSKDIEKCREFKEEFNKFKEDIKLVNKNQQLLNKYLEYVDKDLSLDVVAAEQKIKLDSIKDEISLIKSDIMNSVNVILENSNIEDYDNIKKRIFSSLDYDGAKSTVENVFFQKKIETKK